ncbi:hypothetical protein H4219_004811 [Mycoemilia scoparia]|uniref:KxDL domain-containing protein n=1 Tax=Mycoemilia scoparia TaxID=417184 RepID=A0A9W7ZW28_9FUNG|nr:hypothetical protein H4219_004811 [Mycoemilia scoparia]
MEYGDEASKETKPNSSKTLIGRDETATLQENGSALGLPQVHYLAHILKKQTECIQTAQATVDTLEYSEKVSTYAYDVLSQRYAHHIYTLQQTRSELQQVFTKIRGIKSRISKEHPEIAKRVQTLHHAPIQQPQPQQQHEEDDHADS